MSIYGNSINFYDLKGGARNERCQKLTHILSHIHILVSQLLNDLGLHKGTQHLCASILTLKPVFSHKIYFCLGQNCRNQASRCTKKHSSRTCGKNSLKLLVFRSKLDSPRNKWCKNIPFLSKSVQSHSLSWFTYSYFEMFIGTWWFAPRTLILRWGLKWIYNPSFYQETLKGLEKCNCLTKIVADFQNLPK